MKDKWKDGRFQLGVGFVFLILATIDLIIQGRKYDFDLQELKYLTIFGKVFFGIALLGFGMFLGSLLVAVYKQLFK